MLALMLGTVSYAGGFSLYTEGSPAAIGNFAAGIAAEGADASIGWYNPAGLVLIKKQQFVLGGVGVLPSAVLSGENTYTTLNPANPSGIPFVYSEGFSGLQGGQNAVVPSFHYALPLSDRVVFGLSVVSPFGLSTSYSPHSALRYAGTLSQFESVDVSPELGWELTDHLSFGIGLDVEYARVIFNRIIGSPALMTSAAEVPATTVDSETYNSGSSSSVGFHSGILLMFNENHTRFGFNYQSHKTHDFKGYSQLTGPLADPTLNILEDPTAANPNATYRSNSLFSDDIPLPAILTLSAYQDVNAQWALLGSVVYSAWGAFKTISLNNIAVGLPNPDESGFIIQTTANASTPQNYRDTWRLAVGANYHVNEQWMLRMGTGYDQTPTVIGDRDIRLPDVDRYALSIGAHYQMRPNLGFDLGYTYLLGVSNAVINNTTKISEFSSYNIKGQAKNQAQLLGLQVVWKIDHKA